MTQLPPLAEMSDDQPLTLQEACDVFFRGANTPDTLRAEHRRGNLAIRRVGRQDWTTAGAIREMLRICPAQQKVPASGSTQPMGDTSSSTPETSSSELAAAQMIAEGLKKGFKRTSPPSSAPSTGKVIPLAFPSPRS